VWDYNLGILLISFIDPNHREPELIYTQLDVSTTYNMVLLSTKKCPPISYTSIYPSTCTDNITMTFFNYNNGNLVYTNDFSDII
jgi:hypothetical protein